MASPLLLPCLFPRPNLLFCPGVSSSEEELVVESSSSLSTGLSQAGFFPTEKVVGYRARPGASHRGAAATRAVCHCLDTTGLAFLREVIGGSSSLYGSWSADTGVPAGLVGLLLRLATVSALFEGTLFVLALVPAGVGGTLLILATVSAVIV